MERIRGRKRQTKTSVASTRSPVSNEVQSNEQQGSSSASGHGITARIVIQPAPKSFRFRYKCECEGRSAGSIPGAASYQQSDSDIKTYPTIEVTGHTGPVQIIVSCITAEEINNTGKYRAHPHNLVSRNFCVDGYCRKSVQPNETIIPFNFGIQCCKVDEAKASLEVREAKDIDPFRVGFDHKNNVASINMKAVRLCFQVYFQKEGRFFALPPLVSNIIYDSKTLNEFLIREVSQCSGPMDGGTKNILLCNQLGKENVSVTFFEEQNGTIVWLKDAEIKYIHKGLAIVFHIPKYKELTNYQQGNNAEVFMQLRKNGAESNAVPFEYIAPNMSDYIKRKKLKPIMSVLAQTPASYREMGVVTPNVDTTDLTQTQGNTSTYDIVTPAPYTTATSFQQWPSSLEASSLLNTFLNDQLTIDQPSTFAMQNHNLAFVNPNQSSSCVDPNQSLSYVDPNQSLSYVDPNQSLSYVDPNQSLSYVDPNQSSSHVDLKEALAFVDQNVREQTYIQLHSQNDFGQNLQMPCNVDVHFNDAQEVIDKDINYILSNLDLPEVPERDSLGTSGTCADGDVESLSRIFKNNKISH